MIAWLLSVAAAATAPPTCDAAKLRPAIAAASAALEKKQTSAARAAIAPALACPVTDATSYAAHVLAADVAVTGQDWTTARSALANVGVHAESPLSARAGYLRLRADQGAGDAAAFTADRAALLAANDARLATAGRRTESFRVGTMQVQVYEAAVTQGAFRRTTEFIATPDDPAAYPVAVLLGKDSLADQLVAKANDAPPTAPKPDVWFLDLYTCMTHQTLAMLRGGPDGQPPAYADVKAKVIAVLGGKDQPVTSTARPDAACYGGRWLLPGLGTR